MKEKAINTLAKLKSRTSPLAERLRGFWEDESGMGTVEVILIIVVLIGLVIVFKKEIDGLVSEIFKTINSNAAKVTG